MSNKLKISVFFLLIILTGCATSYNSQLVPKTKSQLQQNHFGAYTELKTSSQQFIGEFIAVSHDSIYLLTMQKLIVMSIDSISSFRLILIQNNASTYVVMTISAIIPSLIGAGATDPEYSSAFLAISAICGVTGFIATGIESSRKPMIVEYPDEKKPIDSYSKYARFPAGLPQGITHEAIENAEWRKTKLSAY